VAIAVRKAFLNSRMKKITETLANVLS